LPQYILRKGRCEVIITEKSLDHAQKKAKRIEGVIVHKTEVAVPPIESLHEGGPSSLFILLFFEYLLLRLKCLFLFA
jgi:hypothetical protein